MYILKHEMIKPFILLLIINAFSLFLFTNCSADNPIDNDSLSTNSQNEIMYGSVSDIDGNIYKTVTIGTQTWMAENLKVTKYNDGTDISYITEDSNDIFSSEAASKDYDFDPSNSDTFGKLYNMLAVNTGKLAPKGWHVPTVDEWEILSDYLGGEEVAGGKLKESGYTHWNVPNNGATNETGFTAIAGIDRESAVWWTASKNGVLSWHVFINTRFSGIFIREYNRNSYFSIRCIKDSI